MGLNVRAITVLVIMMLTANTAGAVLGDIQFQRDGEGDSADSTPPAYFPHWKHRIHFKCYVCHNSIFQMKAGTTKISMEEILKGKFCGTCHNGKQAWAAGFDTCPRCHKEK